MSLKLWLLFGLVVFVFTLTGCTDEVERVQRELHRQTAEATLVAGITEDAKEFCQPGLYTGVDESFSHVPTDMTYLIHRYAEENYSSQYTCWTGIVLAGGGDVYAVDPGKVVWVGTLYCLDCRGSSAIVIDHGDGIYTSYSHVEQPAVQIGEFVDAGQVIAQQGDDGFAEWEQVFFEVHVGGEFTYDWQTPWKEGTFNDPCKWLPQGACE